MGLSVCHFFSLWFHRRITALVVTCSSPILLAFHRECSLSIQQVFRNYSCSSKQMILKPRLMPFRNCFNWTSLDFLSHLCCNDLRVQVWTQPGTLQLHYQGSCHCARPRYPSLWLWFRARRKLWSRSWTSQFPANTEEYACHQISHRKMIHARINLCILNPIRPAFRAFA